MRAGARATSSSVLNAALRRLSSTVVQAGASDVEEVNPEKTADSPSALLRIEMTE